MLVKYWLNEAGTFLRVSTKYAFLVAIHLRLNSVHGALGLLSSGIIMLKFPPLVALTRPSVPSISDFDGCQVFFWTWITAR